MQTDAAAESSRSTTKTGHFSSWTATVAWRIEAEWQSRSPLRNMKVPDVAGDLKTVEVVHQAVFAVGGKDVTLLPMSVGDKEVFFVFRDATGGR